MIVFRMKNSDELPAKWLKIKEKEKEEKDVSIEEDVFFAEENGDEGVLFDEDILDKEEEKEEKEKDEEENTFDDFSFNFNNVNIEDLSST